MSVNTSEYRLQCKAQDESWLLQERQKYLQMSILASWTSILGIVFVPLTSGLSLLASALSSVARIRHVDIKLEILHEELQERYGNSWRSSGVGAAKGLTASVVPSNPPNPERRSQNYFEELTSTSEISPSIQLLARSLVPVTYICMVHSLVRIFGLGSTFKAFAFYLIPIIGLFWTLKFKKLQTIESTGSNGRFRSPFRRARAIVFVLLDFLRFIIFSITLNVLDIAGFLGDPISSVDNGLSRALSSFFPEAPRATGIVRIRWTCVCV